jgi:septal ring factor EnvC (AmiA/AmiB activator)
MKGRMIHFATAVMTAGLFSTALTACVSSGTYEQVKTEAEDLNKRYQAERARSSDLATQNKQQKQKIDQLEASLHGWREELARTEKEWKEMRDNLLKFKVEYEMQRSGTRDRFRVEPEKIELDTKAASNGQASSTDAKRRLRELKDVLQHVQGLLE